MLVHSPMNKRAINLLALFVVPAAAFAKNAICSQWQARALQTQSKQPGSCIPLITQCPSLIQVARIGFKKQITAAPTATRRSMEVVG
jgi:hypothetical protein